MTTAYTTSLRLALMTPGDPVVKNQWGTVLDATITAIDAAIAGVSNIVLSGTTYTLSTANNAPDQDRPIVWQFTGTLSATCTVTIPSATKLGIAVNSTGQPVILTTGSGTTLTLPIGETVLFGCDGTNVQGFFIQSWPSKPFANSANSPVTVVVGSPAPVFNVRVWGPGGAGGDGGTGAGGGGASGAYFEGKYPTSVGETLTLNAGAGQPSQGSVGVSTVVSNINGTLVGVGGGGQGETGATGRAAGSAAWGTFTSAPVASFISGTSIQLIGMAGGDGFATSGFFFSGSGAAGALGGAGGASAKLATGTFNGWYGQGFGAGGGGGINAGTGGSGGSGAIILDPT